MEKIIAYFMLLLVVGIIFYLLKLPDKNLKHEK